MADGKVEIDLELNGEKAKSEAAKAGRGIGEQVETAVDGASAKTRNFAGKLKGLALTMAAAFSVDKIVDFGKAAVKAAADVEAEEAAYSQIMGSYADQASKKLDQVADKTGIVSTRMTDNFTSMTAKFKGLGFGVEDATDMAARGLTLAADGAAFWNTSLDESQEHLNSFINGNYEGGEAIGLFANDTQMAAYAVKEGIIDETKEWANLDEATKQATRLEYAENMYAMSGATGQAAREADEYANVMANAAENVRQFMAIIGEPIKNDLVAPIVEEMSTALSEIGPMLEKGYFSGAGTLVADSLSNILKIIVDMLPQALQAGVDFIGGFALGIVENLPSIVVSVVDAIAQALPMILESLLMLANEIVTALPDIMLSIAEAIPQIIESISQSLADSSGVLVEGFTTLFETLIDIMPEIAQILIESIPQIIETMATAFSENGDVLIEGFIQLFMVLVEAIPQIVSMLIVYIPQIIVALVSALIQNAPTLMMGFVQLFVAFVQALPQIIAMIVAAIPQLINAIVTSITSLGRGQLPNTARNIFTAFISGMGSMLGGIGSKALSLGLAVVKNVRSGAIGTAREGAAAINHFISGIGSLAGSVASKASSVARNVASGLRDGIGDLASIGSNAMQGLVNGMGNMVDWAIGQVRSFGSSIINGLKDFLGIHSPSTLLRDEVGKFMAEGIVVGFLDVDPMDQIERSFTAGIDGLKMSSMGSTTNTHNNSQVINFNQPVKSPDQITRELRMYRMYGLAGSKEFA